MALLFIHVFLYFFFNDTATTEIYTLSLHDALPISPTRLAALTKPKDPRRWKNQSVRCPVRNEQIQDRTLAGCPPLYRSDRMFPVIVSSSEGNRRHHVDGLRGFPDRDSHGWRHLRSEERRVGKECRS